MQMIHHFAFPLKPITFIQTFSLSNMARVGPGQRITRAEVLQQSHDILQRLGLNAHSRADFIRYLCAEILNSRNPTFVRFEPNTHDRSSVSWDQAYGFVFQYLLFYRLTGTIETATAEFKDGIPDVPIISTDEQFRGLLSVAALIPSLVSRVDELFPKKQKRLGQIMSPRVLRRGMKTQTPAQRRKGGKARSGKSTGLAENAMKAQLIIASPFKDPDFHSMDSEELGSDIIITEIFEKPSKLPDGA
jgi:hypothetical protein